jgi:hypothetical protein
LKLGCFSFYLGVHTCGWNSECCLLTARMENLGERI